MEKDEIEQLIRKYIRDNFILRPHVFPSTLAEVVQLSKILGESYWEHRDRLEEVRDKQAGVTVVDYQEWCISELSELKKMPLYN